MGICESSNHGKPLSSEIISKKPEVNPNDQTMEYNNNNNDFNQEEKSGLRPSIFDKTDHITSMAQENKPNLKPELAQYDRSIYYSGRRSELTNTKTSIVSSGVSEQELIIRGEINGKAKEGDFANDSFRRLIQNKKGIILTESEYNSNLGESRRACFFDLGKENISEIHSKISSSMKPNGANINSSGNDFGLSSIKMGNLNQKNLNNINNKDIVNNYQNGGVISGKYDINGKLIPNQTNIPINNKCNVGMNNNNISKLLGRNSNIRGSSKINISLHESCPRVDSYLNIPRNDQPLPDVDELSDSMDLN